MPRVVVARVELSAKPVVESLIRILIVSAGLHQEHSVSHSSTTSEALGSSVAFRGVSHRSDLRIVVGNPLIGWDGNTRSFN